MQGWKNHETWIVYSWITNDGDDYKYVLHAIKEKTNDFDDAAKIIKNYVEDNYPLSYPCLYGDILQAALEKVDYLEIAKAIIGGDK